MYLLKHDEVFEKLITTGYLDSLKLLDDEENILELDYQALAKIGLGTRENNYLYVVYKPERPAPNHTESGIGNFFFYEVNKDDIIGSGDDATVYRGKDLTNNKNVALKGGPGINDRWYKAWKLAYQQLNSHPNFVKTLVLGRKCYPASVSHLLCDDDRAIQIVIEVQNATNFCSLLSRSSKWTKIEIHRFINAVLDTQDAFLERGISGHDSTCGNALVDSSDNPVLIDFDGLELDKNGFTPHHGHRYGDLPVNALFQIYGHIARIESVDLHSNEISDKIFSLLKNLRKVLAAPENKKISRKEANELFRTVINEIELFKSEIYSKKKSLEDAKKMEACEMENSSKEKQACDDNSPDPNKPEDSSAPVSKSKTAPTFFGIPMAEARPLGTDSRLNLQVLSARPKEEVEKEEVFQTSKASKLSSFSCSFSSIPNFFLGFSAAAILVGSCVAKPLLEALGLRHVDKPKEGDIEQDKYEKLAKRVKKKLALAKKAIDLIPVVKDKECLLCDWEFQQDIFEGRQKKANEEDFELLEDLDNCVLDFQNRYPQYKKFLSTSSQKTSGATKPGK